MFTCPADSIQNWRSLLDVISPPSDYVTRKDPPYDTVIADGMAEAGVHDSALFGPKDIDGRPNGICFGITILPDPGTIGSSVKSESGPIISRDLLPIRADVDLLREGRVVDGDFGTQWDLPSEVLRNVDGLAWHQQFYATHAGYFPPNTDLPGGYEYQAVLQDRDGNGWDIAVPFQVVPPEPCDFNADGSCNSDDLTRRTLFRTNLANGSASVSIVKTYDINGDGVVNADDLSFWLDDVARRNGFDSAYVAGDANLDGGVSFEDFLALSENFNSSNRDWADGNFNGDGAIDFADFLALSANFGATLTRTEMAAVPEPSAAALLLVGASLLCFVRSGPRMLRPGSSPTFWCEFFANRYDASRFSTNFGKE